MKIFAYLCLWFVCQGAPCRGWALELPHPFPNLETAAEWAPRVLEATQNYEHYQTHHCDGMWFSPFSRTLLDGGLFVSPNEHQPKDSLPHLQNRPSRGAYLAVGTERGFIGAALTNATALYLVDYSKGAFVFNTLNTFLLQASTDRENYIHYRLDASEEEWHALLSTFGALSTGQKNGLIAFWNYFARNPKHNFLKDINGFFFLNRHPLTMLRPAFQDANYLFDDTLFLRLQNLAKGGQILSLVGDISRPRETFFMVEAIKNHGHSVAVFDWSNILGFINTYGSATDLVESMTLWHQVAHPRALILGTSPGPAWDTGSEGQVALANLWRYRSMPFASALASSKNVEPQEWVTFNEE